MDQNLLCEFCQDLTINDSANELRIPSDNRLDRLVFALGYFQITFDGDSKDDKPHHYSFMPLQFKRIDNLPDLSSLTASAAKGCSFCGMLKSTLQRHELCSSSPGSVISITEARYELHCGLKTEEEAFGDWFERFSLDALSLLVKVGESQQFRLWFKISAPTGQCASWLNIRRRPLREYPFWKDGDKMLRSWLVGHTENCHLCQGRPSSGRPPTRLIDVGTLPSPEPRLVVTEQNPDIFGTPGQKSPGYLILSYCWGAGKFDFKTTSKNFQSYCQTIPLDTFPKTCRDAVELTRALGFQYLWIDAFCIIQEDDEDWKRESLKMVDAYRNAFLTIIPLRSNSSYDGFLQQIPRTVRIPFNSTKRPGLQGEYSLCEVQTESREVAARDGLEFLKRKPLGWYEVFEKETHDSKWNGRGWTFQEALMSPRKLRIGAESLYLECCGFHRADTEDQKIFTVSQLENFPWVHGMYEERSKERAISRFWYCFMDNYSTRKLTDIRDRLPAVSSFAQLISQVTGYKYVAGLFLEDINRGLLWEKRPKSAGFKSHFDAKQAYVDPSWSWASTDATNYGWIWQCGEYAKADCNIEVKVDVDKANPFGRVEGSGRLIVTSQAYYSSSMRLHYTRSAFAFPSGRSDEENESQLTLEDDMGFQAQVEFDWVIPLKRDDNFRISDQEIGDYGPLQGIRLIPLITDSKFPRKSVLGLIVVLPQGSTTGESLWKRAGIFSCGDFEGNFTAKQRFEQCPLQTFIIS